MGIATNFDSRDTLTIDGVKRISEPEKDLFEDNSHFQKLKSAAAVPTISPFPLNVTAISPTFAPAMQKVLKVIQKPHIQGSTAYVEMVRRATPKELADLEAELSKLLEKEKNINLLQEALRSGNWKSSIFKTKKYPYIALEALKRDLITKEDFATVQIFWEVQQAHSKDKILTIHLFKHNGELNFPAMHLLKQTLIMNKPPENAMEKYYEPYYFQNEEQLDEFLKKMKELPKSQQVLWVVPDIYTGKKDGLALLKKQGFNLFGQVNGDRIIPSLGLMQTYLNVKFKDNAVQINPVLGLSSLKDIVQNGKTHTRDLAFHHPAIALPDTADDASAKWYSFFYHDFLHATVCSSVPKILRPVCADLAWALFQFLENNPVTAKQEKKIRSLIELWADQFELNFKEHCTIPEIFWINFNQECLHNIAEKLNPDMQKKLLHDLVSILVKVPDLQEGPCPVLDSEYPTEQQRLLFEIWDQLKKSKL